MPRMESKAVPEGNDPVPQQEEFGSGQPTLADVIECLNNDSINRTGTGTV